MGREERPAESAGLPQRRRGMAADDVRGELLPGEPGAADSAPPLTESLLRVLEGLKRL